MFIVTEHNQLFLRSFRSETRRAPKGATRYLWAIRFYKHFPPTEGGWVELSSYILLLLSRSSFFREYLREVHQRFRSFFETAPRVELELAMKVVTAGKKIGRWQSFKRQI
jgi:hypothetical protein